MKSAGAVLRGAVVGTLFLIVFFGCTKRRTPPTGVAPPPPTPASTAVVRMAGTSFTPRDTTVSPGDTILWVGVQGFHTSTSGPCSPCTPDGLWDSGFMAPGDSFRVVFGAGVDIPGVIAHVDSSGHFPYYCDPHATVGMHGSITVTP